MATKTKKITHEEVKRLAKEGREMANKMTDEERQSALALAMQMIYGGKNGKKAICR